MKRFSSESNGYNRKEVNQFLSDVVKETNQIAKKYKQQEKQIRELKKEIAHYKELQGTIQKTIIQNEKDKIILEAKKDASKIINDALERAEQLEEERTLLEKNMEIFKKKLQLIIAQQHMIVDQIDQLEIQE